jgi:hypothetical protein
MPGGGKGDPSCAKFALGDSCDKTSQSSKSSSSSRCSLSSNGRCPELNRAMESVRYIVECTKQEEESDKVREDWKFVAMVLDRLFLWIFSVAVVGEFFLSYQTNQNIIDLFWLYLFIVYYSVKLQVLILVS